MSDSLEIDELKEEKLKELLPRNIHFLHVRKLELEERLKTIRPQEGNFLFSDLIGRIVWQACATSNSILILAENYDDYGVKSLTRKIFESYLLLYYLFDAKDKTKEIAKIMASELRKNKEKDHSEAIASIEKIIEHYKEDKRIISEFRNQISLKNKHWHWTGQSFRKIIDKLDNNLKDEKVNNRFKNLKTELLSNFNENAHIDLCLDEDFLETSLNGQLEYKSPNTTSLNLLFGYIGLIMLIIDDIINLLDKNKETFGNIGS